MLSSFGASSANRRVSISIPNKSPRDLMQRKVVLLVVVVVELCLHFISLGLSLGGLTPESMNGGGTVKHRIRAKKKKRSSSHRVTCYISLSLIVSFEERSLKVPF